MNEPTAEDMARNLDDDLKLALNKGKTLVSEPGAVIEAWVCVSPQGAWPILEAACRRALAAEEAARRRLGVMRQQEAEADQLRAEVLRLRALCSLPPPR